ncbi:MAG: heme-binding protein [Deltaproteobacteria bacterium]|nr:heme-binding protein [Deltaproteobacteria bacterium]
MLSTLIAAPVVAGLLGERSLKRGLLVGGVAALALGALRLQMARWFTPEPDYTTEGRVGDLALRRYPARVDARAEINAIDFEDALELGYERLRSFIRGANATDEGLVMAMPVTTMMRDGRYEMSFVMPADRVVSTLPQPEDPRVQLREVPERRIAVLRFNGRFTKKNVEWQERKLLRKLVDAGLSARGSVMFACYDPPTTLPLLRRNELWIEIT